MVTNGRLATIASGNAVAVAPRGPRNIGGNRQKGTDEGVGLCRGEGYDLVGREEFPGRMLCVSRKRCAVTASMLRRSGAENPSAAVLTADKRPHVLRGPAGPHLRGFSSHAAVTRLSPTAPTPPEQNALTWHYSLILD